MAQEMTPAQLERIKQQRSQRFREIGLPATAGMLMDVPVENLPAQRVYNAPSTEVIAEENTSNQYDAQQSVSNVEIPNGSDVSQQILIQLAEERALRQSAMYTAPRDKFNALESIRKGAKKQEFRNFIKAESTGANGNQIPEPKVGKRRMARPGQPQQVSEGAIAPQTFNSSKNQELDTIERLFSDGSPGINVSSSSRSGNISGNLIETDENYSNIGPSFDPVAHLRTKTQEKGLNIDFSKGKGLIQENNEHQVFNHGKNDQMSQMMLMMETMMKTYQNNNGQDLVSIKVMMEEVARKVSEDTIRKVLKEYLENQKKKNVFEVVNSKQNVVKIEGKYYQLKPVVPKS